MALNSRGDLSGSLMGSPGGAGEILSENQQQGIQFQELIARFVTKRGTRPFVLVGVLVWVSSYSLPLLLGKPIKVLLENCLR